MTSNQRHIQELRNPPHSFLQNGQNCDYCVANTDRAHPASNMVDGTPSWWMSPPLSRGMQYNKINITINLEQEFHVAYVWVQMANSPRPGAWILEKSVDYGQTYTPWQYFSSSPAECARLFGLQSLSPITRDDSIICTSEFSSIQPMENGEIMINLLDGRPSKNNFSSSPVLQEFARATNVRLRLLNTKTLQGNLMDLNERNDPTVTRRYYYAIKEIFMGGRCVCNGHADSCDILDTSRPRTWICRCEHHTCGDNCERCCEGFVQKKWAQSTESKEFVCEPCNCHGHSEECVYDAEIDRLGLSLDIHGNREGGGRCLNCRDHTEGINCNECSSGYYRPAGKTWNETNVCQPCVCDPTKHTQNCAEETGICECLPQFTGPNCDQCAVGYYNPPECRSCECNVNGTVDGTCLPTDGICPCKQGFSSDLCDKCAPGFTNLTAGCVDCECDQTGSVGVECDLNSGQCTCRNNFGGRHCNQCATGHYNYPTCEFCDCDPSGTEGDVCDKNSGQCLCRQGFSGRRCDQCDENFYGYPNCRECACDLTGSKDAHCDETTGACPCYANFTSRTCNRCAAGFYHYPDCWACDCVSAGSKGLTCDSDGQCYCKPNFVGKRCESCKPNFYNYPICEKCDCHPSGVIPEFAGCDKVAPGELCTCRDNVEGRTCNQCKPTFWDLKAQHPEGCIDCNCNMTGTVSLLNLCDQNTGQCMCKRFVSGEKCDQCAEGFYQMQGHLQHGCVPCDCDPGGAIGQTCNPHTGQCRCRPRVEGIRCDKPIKDHYFPTLWQMKYEAESGRLANNKPVRYAIDKNEFPDYSYRGYAVFSPIQDEIYIDLNVPRATVYRLLAHYHNPTNTPVEFTASFTPVDSRTAEEETQKFETSFSSKQEPTSDFVNEVNKPIVLSPGRWLLKVGTKKRLFLDYVVLVPAEYYNPSTLKTHIHQPCNAIEDPDNACLDLLYPPLQLASRVDAASNLDRFQTFNPDGAIRKLNRVPQSELPAIIGQAAAVLPESFSRNVEVELDVPADDTYLAVLEYQNPSNVSMPLRVRVDQVDNEVPLSDGLVYISHCPYNVFCRELISKEGNRAELQLKKSPPKPLVTFSVPANAQFGLVAVNLIRKEDWNNDYLKLVPVCVRKDGKCIGLDYPLPPNSINTAAGSGVNVNNSISGDKLPFEVENAKNVKVIALDTVQGTVDIDGVVTDPGEYVFVVHYYNPDNAPLNVDVLFENEHFGDITFSYCPSVSGCRAIIYDRQKPDQNHFYVNNTYVWTFYHNTKQNGPIYIESISAVPVRTYTPVLLKPKPLDQKNDFFTYCSELNYKNAPQNVTDFCKSQVFSLTAEYNGGALSCDCNPKGSVDFCCEEYGGECECKPNVIGRACDRCAPGYYNFPDCQPCKCTAHELCNEQTGACYCPNYATGPNCDQCVPFAYGFDVLIGCQLCECNQQGSHNEEKQCDPLSGQCLCKENVGGRRCEKCLPGFYGFPQCYPCACDQKGTVADICNPQNAECLCKKNVVGRSCDSCRSGTFDLRQSHPDGCANCFCFGVTDKCHSSHFPVQKFKFDDQAWTMNNSVGTVRAENGRVIFEYDVDKRTNDQPDYFVVPVNWTNGYTNSYGLHMSFIISCDSADPKRTPTVNSDIILVASDGTKLEFWATEQPSNASKPFKVEVTLLPESWITQKDGHPTTRAELMMVLHKLSKILIKAAYYTPITSAVIEQFELEVAEPNYNNGNQLTASSVEQCECPAPYTGPSCQFCSSGYYRVKSESHLGSCVPCNCHGHSGTCDPDTGICSECQHYTEGDHCERCIGGYYGNATNGSPYPCLSCPCPYASDSNNFATSCNVSESGNLLRCNCKDGYAGDRCERCANGFFGDPMTHGATCKECFCNENNDLSVDGACNPSTGDCAFCENNSDGRSCEYCKQWYYGDAIQAKNCTECACNKCGSTECDNQNGVCHCQPLVDGANCDRCVENAWGFDGCKGCRMCECGVAASNSQCDAKTGKCACMPGATGQRCERCENGFWDYSSQGCKKCDCEADLSEGTVCNIYTGQCQCQEGATGPRCDTCEEGYLRIPGHGCRRCEECAVSLNKEIDDLDLLADFLNGQLGNVSSVALTGARLSRAQKRMKELNPFVQYVISLLDTDGMQNLTKSGFDAENGVKVLDLQANRTYTQLSANHERVNNMLKDLRQIRSDVNDLIGTGNWVLDEIRGLVPEFENRDNVANTNELIAQAETLLKSIREAADKTIEYNVKEVSEKFDVDSELLQQARSRKEERQNYAVDLQKRLNALNNSTRIYEEEIENVRKNVNRAKEIMDSLNLSHLKTLHEGVEKDAKKKKDEKVEIRKKLETIQEKLNEIRESMETIGELQPQIQTWRQDIQSRHNLNSRARRSPSDEKIQEAKSHTMKLEQQARNIQRTYNQTVDRDDVARPLEAITIYQLLRDMLADAHTKSEKALTTANEANQIVKDTTTPAKERRVDLEKLESTRKEHAEKLEKQSRDAETQQNRLQKLESTIEQKKSILDKMNMPNEIATDLDKTSGLVDDANSLLEQNSAAIEDFKSRTNESLTRTEEAVELQTNISQAKNGARTMLNTIDSTIPNVQSSFDDAQRRIKNTTAMIEEYKMKLAALKEKVASVRDKANRIKSGAHLKDSRGLRFGLEPGSRVEFTNLPNDMDKNLVINLELRSNSANGIVLFMTNEKHTDHVALYILDGKVSLSYGSGSARLVIQSSFSILDDEWHSVRAEREGASASLFVDNEQVANDQIAEDEQIQLEAPIYFGGLAKDLHSFTARLLPGVMPEFGGCLRDLKLNNVSYKAEEVHKKNGVASCSTKRENGIFFGKDGGYARIKEFTAEKQFHFELEIKPRVKKAVLLSVGGVDFVTLQLVNGSVKLTVDDGGGASSIIYTPPQGALINDGNWHRIKAIRKKSIVTLNVDGKSNLMVIKKKGNIESPLNDPLYFGGVPRDRLGGLDTEDSYVGCMRIHSVSSEPKVKRSDLDLSSLEFFGTGIDKEGCNLN
ncbi:Laminin alpha [Aphelenchoides besseyi]|nr:Laminin alpha [Aphelenchoides besseyi]